MASKKRIEIKDQRVQTLLMLLLLAVFASATAETVANICLAGILSSSGAVTTGETLRAWSRVKRRRGRNYYVEYRLQIDERSYESEHKVPRELMESAREKGIVPIYYLAGAPAIHAPAFWGASLGNYVIAQSWSMIGEVVICAILIMVIVSLAKK